MSRILLVGTATLDLIFELDHHPAQDEEMRAKSLRTSRGGNAANTAVVLARLGHVPQFLGVLADTPETAVIENDFSHHGVEFGSCPKLSGKPPTSSIFLTKGCRSIVHYRDLPELPAENFFSTSLNDVNWVHFEGRNVPEMKRMLANLRSRRPDIPVSIELEKHREGIEQLFDQANLLLCSRGFARHHGFEGAHSFLSWMSSQAGGAEVIVAWGEAGAFGVGDEGRVFHSPAMPPPIVRDTLGAGDTFNAAIIDAKLRGSALWPALEDGCRLAGIKCGIEGFDVQ